MALSNRISRLIADAEADGTTAKRTEDVRSPDADLRGAARTALPIAAVAGNQAIGKAIQTKLTLGPAGDRYEQEADRVAKQVMGSLDTSPAGVEAATAQRQPEEEELLQGKLLQRQEDEELMMSRVQRQEDEELLQGKLLQRQEDEELMMSRVQRQEDEELLQGKLLQRQEDEELMMSRVQRQEDEELMMSRVQRQEDEELMMKPVRRQAIDEPADVDPGIESAIQMARGSGAALDAGVRGPMEQSFGADFSGVRVHTGGEADTLNNSLQARAFTTGQDIFFRSGDYNPASKGGQELIAHELTHVVQQNGSAVQKDPLD